MKKLIFLLVLVLTASCSTSKKASSVIPEDELIITRKYVGVFMEYRHTGPENYDGPNIVWIKTSMEDLYGNISAYGKKC
jgi:hypothetical protein